MLIRYGYEITVNCAQPTPMVCLLSVSDDRKADIRVAEKVFTTPIIPTTTYLDTFGNRCRRLVAPAGDFAIWGDATIEDDGKIDPANFAAREVPVAELPDYCLLFLMGSRYCETDKLSQTAWDLFGNTPPGWGRVQAVCDFVHQHIKFDYSRRDRRAARSTPTRSGSASAAISPISPSRFADASTFPRATSTAISATSACLWSIRWISAPGSRCSSRARGGRSIRATTCPGSAGSWSHAAGTRRIFRSSTRSDPTS